MKKIFILLTLIILQSCKSRDDLKNEYALASIDSTFSHLNIIRSRASYYDSTINNFVLNDSVQSDTTYVKLCENYEKMKKLILSLDHDSVVKVYESIRMKDPDSAFIYANDFQDYVTTMENEGIKAYYLFYTKKQKLQGKNEVE
jgi:hypothetical protein